MGESTGWRAELDGLGGGSTTLACRRVRLAAEAEIDGLRQEIEDLRGQLDRAVHARAGARLPDGTIAVGLALTCLLGPADATGRSMTSLEIDWSIDPATLEDGDPRGEAMMALLQGLRAYVREACSDLPEVEVQSGTPTFLQDDES